MFFGLFVFFFGGGCFVFVFVLFLLDHTRDKNSLEKRESSHSHQNLTSSSHFYLKECGDVLAYSTVF